MQGEAARSRESVIRGMKRKSGSLRSIRTDITTLTRRLKDACGTEGSAEYHYSISERYFQMNRSDETMNAKEIRRAYLISAARAKLYTLYSENDKLQFTFRHNSIRYLCNKTGSREYTIYAYSGGQYKARFEV